MCVAGNDVLIGKILLLLSATFIVYYTFWTVGLPLLETNFSVNPWFPDISYAICIPLALLTLIISVLSVYAHYLMKFDK